MSELSHKYIDNKEHFSHYNQYQNKHRETIRESDRILVDWVKEILDKKSDTEKPLNILDIGCSTGNLLFHIKKNIIGNYTLTGGEVVESSLEQCLQDEDLKGIQFEKMDILNLPKDSYDIIIANGVLTTLDANEYKKSLISIANSLQHNGHFLLFDYACPFDQDLEIIERTKYHPHGLRLFFLSYGSMRTAYEEAGLSIKNFAPFSMPIDLPHPEQDDDLTSYTHKDEKGNRMCFRGSLFQPWCHIQAELKKP